MKKYLKYFIDYCVIIFFQRNKFKNIKVNLFYKICFFIYIYLSKGGKIWDKIYMIIKIFLLSMTN